MSLLFTRPGFKVLQGDILRDRADLLVCPVNCVPGVMNAGLAKAFAHEFPGLRLRHKWYAETRKLKLCHPVLVRAYRGDREDEILWGDKNDIPVRELILFPTKGNWRNPSRLDFVFRGLANFYDILASYKLEDEEVTVAMPALGCGLGGLEFEVVGQMIAAWAVGLPERFNVHLYRPHEGN